MVDITSHMIRIKMKKRTEKERLVYLEGYEAGVKAMMNYNDKQKSRALLTCIQSIKSLNVKEDTDE